MIDDDSGVVDLGAEGLKTGIPLKSAPDAWLINVFNGLTRMDFIIQTLQGYTDPRMYLFVRNLIIKIPEDNIRENLLRALDNEIIRINALPDLSNEEKGLHRIIASQNAAGSVVAYFDEYVGISRTLVIGKI
jgi:hypothetical protein